MIMNSEHKCWNCIQYETETMLFKGTLMHIWKSANTFVFIWKYYVKHFIFKQLLLIKICARKICEKSVYKHSEAIEYVKN